MFVKLDVPITKFTPEEIVLKEKERLEEQSNRISQLKEILKSIN